MCAAIRRSDVLSIVVALLVVWAIVQFLGCAQPQNIDSITMIEDQAGVCQTQAAGKDGTIYRVIRVDMPRRVDITTRSGQRIVLEGRQ